MSELTHAQEDQLAQYARECLAEAQDSLKRAAELIDAANRTLMEAGLPGWHLADAWSYVGRVQTRIDNHIEAVLRSHPVGNAASAYRLELMLLAPPQPEPHRIEIIPAGEPGAGGERHYGYDPECALDICRRRSLHMPVRS